MFRSPHRLYRLLAVAEVITWALLISGMILKYVLHITELGVRIGGGIHGFVFLAYCAATVLVGVDQRWGAGRIALGLGSAVIPFVTVAFERWAERPVTRFERKGVEVGREISDFLYRRTTAPSVEGQPGLAEQVLEA